MSSKSNEMAVDKKQSKPSASKSSPKGDQKKGKFSKGKKNDFKDGKSAGGKSKAVMFCSIQLLTGLTF